MKIKQTLNEYKCAVFAIGCAASIPLIIFLSTLMDNRCAMPLSEAQVLNRCGNPFINWIYDFQGLITGFSALIAALITIYTMYRNTRDMIYVEWKTTIFKVYFINTQLEQVIKKLTSTIENKIPNTSDNETWLVFIRNIYFNLEHLRSLLNEAEKSGLSIYSLGMVSVDLESVSHLTNDYKQLFYDFTPEGNITIELVATIDTQNTVAIKVFKQVTTGTIFGFDVFLRNTKIISPHNVIV